MDLSALAAFGDASDPTDWPDTYLPVRQLDAALRCEICQEIYSNPRLGNAPTMIRECQHVFCGVCVRQAIADKGECPKCRSKAVQKLLPLPMLETAAKAFFDARGQLLRLVLDAEQRRLRGPTPPPSSSPSPSDSGSLRPRGQKRKASVSPGQSVHDSESTSGESSRMRLRSTTRNRDSVRSESPATGMTTRSASRQAGNLIFVVDDDTNDGDYVPGSPGRDAPARGKAKARTRESSAAGNVANGSSGTMASDQDPNVLVTCFICNKQKKNRDMDAHITRCMNGQLDPPSPRPAGRDGGGTSDLKGWFGSSGMKRPGGQQGQTSTLQPKIVSHTPYPQYNLLSSKALKKMLVDAGLSTSGTEAQWRDRHRHWLMLNNANMERQHPESEHELRRRQRLWEKEQAAPKKATYNIDPRAHQAKYMDQFKDMIDRARSSSKKAKNLADAPDEPCPSSSATVTAAVAGDPERDVVVTPSVGPPRATSLGGEFSDTTTTSAAEMSATHPPENTQWPVAEDGVEDDGIPTSGHNHKEAYVSGAVEIGGHADEKEKEEAGLFVEREPDGDARRR